MPARYCFELLIGYTSLQHLRGLPMTRKKCSRCGGTGKISHWVLKDATHPQGHSEQVKCPWCQGVGSFPELEPLRNNPVSSLDDPPRPSRNEWTKVNFIFAALGFLFAVYVVRTNDKSADILEYIALGTVFAGAAGQFYKVISVLILLYLFAIYAGHVS